MQRTPVRKQSFSDRSLWKHLECVHYECRIRTRYRTCKSVAYLITYGIVCTFRNNTITSKVAPATPESHRACIPSHLRLPLAISYTNKVPGTIVQAVTNVFVHVFPKIRGTPGHMQRRSWHIERNHIGNQPFYPCSNFQIFCRTLIELKLRMHYGAYTLKPFSFFCFAYTCAFSGKFWRVSVWCSSLHIVIWPPSHSETTPTFPKHSGILLDGCNRCIHSMAYHSQNLKLHGPVWNIWKMKHW